MIGALGKTAFKNVAGLLGQRGNITQKDNTDVFALQKRQLIDKHNTFFVGTLIYFICAFLFISNMYGYFEKQIFSELKTESFFLENSVLNQQLDHLSELQTENRITLIHSDGTVYFDNKVDAAKLE